MIFDRDNWIEIFATISKNKLRSFLTMLGVFWGIFMFVIMLGFGNGFINGLNKAFSGVATNSFYIWGQSASKGYKGLKPGRYISFTTQDYATLSNITWIEQISPMLQSWQQNKLSNGIKKTNATLKGAYPNLTILFSVQLAKGRFINDLDITAKRKVCIIGHSIAQKLFDKKENPLNKTIKIDNAYYQVIGVMSSKSGGNFRANEERETVYIPLNTMQQAYNFGSHISWFAIKSFDDVPAEVLEKKVVALLKEKNNIHPDDKKAIGSWNMGAEFKKFTGLFNGVYVLVWLVGIGTILAGIVGISNIMLIVVKERTKEVGIKRALGATPINIISQIVLEAVFLTSIAGYMGLFFGVCILEVIYLALKHGSDFLNPTINFSMALQVLGILIFCGMLAGYMPAKRAVSITPLNALRDE